MDFHTAAGLTYALLPLVFLPAYFRFIYIFVSNTKYRSLECYRIMIQMGVVQCVPIPLSYIGMGLVPIFGYDPLGISAYLIVFYPAALRTEAILGLCLALNRLKIICSLHYSSKIHTGVMMLAWLNFFLFTVVFLTPLAEFKMLPGHFLASFTWEKGWTTQIQLVNFILYMATLVLTLCIYVIIIAYLIRLKISHGSDMEVKDFSILVYAVTRFSVYFSLTIVLYYVEFRKIPEKEVAVTVALILCSTALTPILYFMLYSTLRRQPFAKLSIPCHPIETMDAVPYAFCSAVVALPRRPFPIGCEFPSELWRVAANDNAKNQTNCRLSIAHEHGTWSYRIDQVRASSLGVSNTLTFPEFRKLNKRHVRIDHVQISDSILNPGIRSSFDEIKKIVEHTFSCVNVARLYLCDTANFGSQNQLLELLAFYKNCVFKDVFISEIDDAVLNFLRPHLQSPMLEQLFVGGESCSAALQTAIRNIAFCKTVCNLNCHASEAVFDKKYFRIFFQKPVNHIQHYWFNHSFQFRDFGSFGGVPDDLYLEWRRPDGVKVQVTRTGCNSCLVEFIP